MRESRIRVLVLTAEYTDELSYYDDWSDTLAAYPEFDTRLLNIAHPRAAGGVAAEVAQCDAIVLLHSTNADTVRYLDRVVGALASRRCPLLSFVGNEVNLPGALIADKRRVLGQLSPEWIATQLLQEAGEFLFGDIATKGVVSIPHAVNPKCFYPKIELDARPVEIGTRVARYLPHLGDDDRNRIADRFVELGRTGCLTIDISNQRFNRAGWTAFLNRCKGTVSTEAGSWYLERDDATVSAVRKFIREQSGGLEIAHDSKLLRVGFALPRPLRRLASRAFRAIGGRYEHQPVLRPQQEQDIHRIFFAHKPRPPIYGKCISSRHFDAAGTKTCQLMFRGRFNDILEADKHYLALDHDFANLDEVLRRFKDSGERRAVADRAYEHVMERHTYSHRVQQLADLLRTAA